MDTEKKRKIARGLVGFLTSVSVGAVASNVIKSNTISTGGSVNGVLTAIGSFVLADLISDVAAEHVDEKLVDLMEQFDAAKAATEDNEGE